MSTPPCPQRPELVDLGAARLRGDVGRCERERPTRRLGERPHKVVVWDPDPDQLRVRVEVRVQQRGPYKTAAPGAAAATVSMQAAGAWRGGGRKTSYASGPG